MVQFTNSFCIHTHHQNGIECKHRNIVDLGLSLLHHAYLLLQFWDYVFWYYCTPYQYAPFNSSKFCQSLLYYFQ